MSDLVKQFYGGTVYQAYPSATSYHWWHSLVSGTIYKTELVNGSYYSSTHDIQGDPASPNICMSQGYLAQVASRGIIYIQADNPHIGLMCFVSIGMSEVSSNEITVEEKDKVKKGEQLGMFHYGGSTHLLIFCLGVNIEFHTRGQTPGLHTEVLSTFKLIIPTLAWCASYQLVCQRCPPTKSPLKKRIKWRKVSSLACFTMVGPPIYWYFALELILSSIREVKRQVCIRKIFPLNRKLRPYIHQPKQI